MRGFFPFLLGPHARPKDQPPLLDLHFFFLSAGCAALLQYPRAAPLEPRAGPSRLPQPTFSRPPPFFLPFFPFSPKTALPSLALNEETSRLFIESKHARSYLGLTPLRLTTHLMHHDLTANKREKVRAFFVPSSLSFSIHFSIHFPSVS